MKIDFLKKILFIGLCVLIGFSARAQKIIDGIWYNYDSYVGACVVIPAPSLPSDHPYYGYTYQGDLVIHESIEWNNETQPVTRIRSGAFQNCDELTSIIVPGSIWEIETNAFLNCTNLESVTLSEGLNEISAGAFKGCSSLKEITIPSGLTSILKEAFANTALESIRFLGKVPQNFNWDTFKDSEGINKVYIYDLASWCESFFTDAVCNPLCYGAELYVNDEFITDLVIPEGIEGLNGYNFACAKQLNSVTTSSELRYFNPGVFTSCENLKSVTLNEGLQTISNSVFSKCSALQSIILPSAMSLVGSDAFYKCSSLNSVTVLAETPPQANEYSFGTDTYEQATLYVPLQSIEDYKTAECWKNFFNIQADSNGIEGIHNDSSQGSELMFDLLGRSVNSNYNGIIIQGGKKYMK